MYRASYRSLGASNGDKGAELLVETAPPVITACPQCSRLEAGSCVVCKPGEQHPSCQGCNGGVPEKTPWYQTQFAATVGAMVVASVLTAIIVERITRKR